MNLGSPGELAELQSRESRLQAELQRRQMERRTRQEQRCERRVELLAEVEQQEVGNGGMDALGRAKRKQKVYLQNQLIVGIGYDGTWWLLSCFIISSGIASLSFRTSPKYGSVCVV